MCIRDRAHTVMAEGGMAAALGNVDNRDDWKIHFRDTMRGGKMLNNWKMAEIHAKDAPARVRELEHWGAVFDRTKDGLINQILAVSLTKTFGKVKTAKLETKSDSSKTDLSWLGWSGASRAKAVQISFFYTFISWTITVFRFPCLSKQLENFRVTNSSCLKFKHLIA